MVHTVNILVQGSLLLKVGLNGSLVEVERESHWTLLIEHHWHGFHRPSFDSSSSFRVIVVKHPVFNFWEHFNKRSTLDLGAFSDPGHEGAHCSLVESLAFSKDWEEFFPILLVNSVASLLPSGDYISNFFVVLNIGSLEFSGIGIGLIIIEIKEPLWSKATSTGTAS